MNGPVGLRRPHLGAVVVPLLVCAGLVCLLPLGGEAIVAAAAEQGPAPVALPDSVCEGLVEAFAKLDVGLLGEVLAPSALQVALDADGVSGARSADRSTERRMSAEQAIVLLREVLLVAEGREVLPPMDPRSIVSADSTSACRCPETGSSGGDAFLVLHLGAATPGSEVRRLYLDLRRHDIPGEGPRWRVHAIRELP